VSASATIEVLAEPNRRQILDALREGEQPVNALVARLSLSQPAVSKHLRVLRDAGLVAVRPEGQRRLYHVRVEPLMELDVWLEPYRQMWRASLDKLERHLHEPQTEPRSRRKPT
jgi:DNA-binding transcriptional ArsR family regulator